MGHFTLVMYSEFQFLVSGRLNAGFQEYTVLEVGEIQKLYNQVEVHFSTFCFVALLENEK